MCRGALVPFCFSRSLSCAHCVSGRQPRGTFCAHARSADYARIAIICLIFFFFFVQLLLKYFGTLLLCFTVANGVSSTTSQTTVVIVTKSVYCRWKRKVSITISGGPAILIALVYHHRQKVVLRVLYQSAAIFVLRTRSRYVLTFAHMLCLVYLFLRLP